MLQAIEFAKEKNDDDLWENLLRHSETRPRKFHEHGYLYHMSTILDDLKALFGDC